MSKVYFPPIFTRLTLITIHFGDMLLILDALIDSVADDSFIDITVVWKFLIPTVKVVEPCQVSALDGIIIGVASLSALPLELCVNGDHQERIQLLL